MTPRFFKSQKEWRAWLEKNHARETELLVGFHKTKTGNGGLTYKQALDDALAFGWIDAVRFGGDATWSIRFTRRKPKSIWSAINIRRIAELNAQGRMHAAGLAAYEGRDPERQKKYSHENRDRTLAPAQLKLFRANKAAWKNFRTMPPSYQHPAIWWVVSAQKEETRQRRLATLISDSEAGRKIKLMRRPGDKT